MPVTTRAVRILGRVARGARSVRSRALERRLRELRVRGEGAALRVEAVTGSSLRLGHLFLRCEEAWVPVGGLTERTDTTASGSRRFEGTIDLSRVQLPDAGLSGPAGAPTMWVEVTDGHGRPPAPDVEVTVEATGEVRYRAPLGRFRRTWVTSLPTVRTGGATPHVLSPHVDVEGRLAVAVDTGVPDGVGVTVSRLRITDGRLTIRGQLVTSQVSVGGARLALVGRRGTYRATAPLAVEVDEPATERGFGLPRFSFDGSHDFDQDIGTRLVSDTIADLWVELLRPDGSPIARGRVGSTPYAVRRRTNDGWVARGERTVAITPYYTFRGKNTSVHLELFSTAAHSHLRRLMRHPRDVRAMRRRAERPVWVVGELPYKAQGNGLHLFRHLRENHPEIDAYYVIERDSPERAGLAGLLDHVVDYRSTEHIDVVARADRIIGTHHPDFLYPTRAARFRRLMSASEVFLQHGVMGTKWMVPNYGKHVPDFRTDLFIVSSEREKEYIVHDFGYDPEEVAVTGLARFDALFAGDVPVRSGQILVLPTWRDWLQDPDTFTQSDYYHEWLALVHSPRLARLRRECGGEVVLCLHPNMQQFSHLFRGGGVRVVVQGEVEVQALLKESQVLITDYSSPAFDFAFLGKPVIYFQFDLECFLGASGSHLDLRAELPGPIEHDAEAVLDRLEEILARGGSMDPRYSRRADVFISHRDRNNCERIVEAVREARRDRSLGTSIARSEAVTLAARRARRHRLYFPAMRRLMAVARALPQRADAILFESGVGRQYGDSPRYIYEELVRRRDPRKKVWVLDRSVPVRDEHLVVVRRLSPAYFWHLGRSRYWVNNQNFPHYVRRRRNGVYVQTWHGTPLKRMLHDLDRVVGRDEGYVDRVSAAVSQWTTLVSPSPYATRAFRSAFRYDGHVLEVGSPRNDVLVRPPDPELVERVRHGLDLPDGKRVVLYAPTFRDDATTARQFTFEVPFDLEAFAQEFGSDTVLLVRMHLLVATSVDIPGHLRNTIRDVSRYPEIQELLLISDTLVTDYSSVFFDFALLGRPMVFHAYDLDQYRDHVRGFYLDFPADVPGPVTHTQDELFAALKETRELSPGQRQRILTFARTFAPHDDGLASQRVVDAVLSLPGGKGSRRGRGRT